MSSSVDGVFRPELGGMGDVLRLYEGVGSAGTGGGEYCAWDGKDDVPEKEREGVNGGAITGPKSS